MDLMKILLIGSFGCIGCVIFGVLVVVYEVVGLDCSFFVIMCIIVDVSDW